MCKYLAISQHQSISYLLVLPSRPNSSEYRERSAQILRNTAYSPLTTILNFDLEKNGLIHRFLPFCSFSDAALNPFNFNSNEMKVLGINYL